MNGYQAGQECCLFLLCLQNPAYRPTAAVFYFGEKRLKILRHHQATIAHSVFFTGIGVHSGEISHLEIRSAPVDHGVVFVRRFVNGRDSRLIARSENNRAHDLCTTLGQGEGRIETIEHLMAAISACGIDNLEIVVSHHEVPILDGSAVPFIKAFVDAGIVRQDAPRQKLRIIEPLRLESDLAFAEFLPVDCASPVCHFDISIDFASPVIGRQHIAFDLETSFFASDIAPARTFGFSHEAEMLRARGLAQGASLDNCLVIGPDDRLLNPKNLRFKDEFVRHKALDAVGDTALLGMPFMGIFRSHRPSHRLNGEIVKALLANPDHFEIIA